MKATVDTTTTTVIEVDIDTNKLRDEIIRHFLNAVYDQEPDVPPLEFMFDADDFKNAAGLDLYELSEDATIIIYAARNEARNAYADSVRFS